MTTIKIKSLNNTELTIQDINNQLKSLLPFNHGSLNIKQKIDELLEAKRELNK